MKYIKKNPFKRKAQALLIEGWRDMKRGQGKVDRAIFMMALGKRNGDRKK